MPHKTDAGHTFFSATNGQVTEKKKKTDSKVWGGDIYQIFSGLSLISSVSSTNSRELLMGEKHASVLFVWFVFEISLIS